MSQEETVQFSNQELQIKYSFAKRISDEHLKYLDVIGVDIRRVEAFLQRSGFGEFEKSYNSAERERVPMNWDGQRLRYGSVNLIETKVKQRLEAYPFLGDFLESIASIHRRPGEKKNEDH